MYRIANAVAAAVRNGQTVRPMPPEHPSTPSDELGRAASARACGALAPVATPPSTGVADTAAESRRLAVYWILSLVVVFGGSWLWIATTRPPNANVIWGLIAGLATFPGKYLIFTTLVDGSPLGPWQLVVLATLVDAATALTVAIGLGMVAQVPWVARTLKRVHDQAQLAIAEYPRIRRMAFWGVVTFVFLPLPASGSIGGSFVGQFVGLTRLSGVAAVTLGGLFVSIVFALLATFVGSRARDMLQNPWLVVASTAGFALFAWIAWRRARAMLRES